MSVLLLKGLCNNHPVECLAVVPRNPLKVNRVNVIASSKANFKSDVFISMDGARPTPEDIVMTVIEPSTSTFDSTECFEMQQTRELVKFIDSIQPGKIVAATIHSCTSQQLSDEARTALQQIGSFRIWDVSNQTSWAIIGVKGSAPGSMPELQTSNGVVAVQLTCRIDPVKLASSQQTQLTVRSSGGGESSLVESQALCDEHTSGATAVHTEPRYLTIQQQLLLRLLVLVLFQSIIRLCSDCWCCVLH